MRGSQDRAGATGRAGGLAILGESSCISRSSELVPSRDAWHCGALVVASPIAAFSPVLDGAKYVAASWRVKRSRGVVAAVRAARALHLPFQGEAERLVSRARQTQRL